MSATSSGPAQVSLSKQQVLAEVDFIENRLLDSEGRIRLLPASFYLEQPSYRVALWGAWLGIFVFPTTELIGWLHRRVIRGRRAIEVGAGLGDLARYLAIPATDSYRICEDPAVIRRFAIANHRTPQLVPEHTARLTAAEAIAKYRPEVVIAGWTVEKASALGPTAGASSGIDETAIVEQADYCLLGHEIPHRGKRVLQLTHTELDMPWLISRAPTRSGNRIWLFNCTPQVRSLG